MKRGGKGVVKEEYVERVEDGQGRGESRGLGRGGWSK